KLNHNPTYTSPFRCNATALTEIYTLSLHDALPICDQSHRSGPLHGGRRSGVPPSRARARVRRRAGRDPGGERIGDRPADPPGRRDRKSTRLNSSHDQISYAVFCLKKKKTINKSLLL